MMSNWETSIKDTKDQTIKICSREPKFFGQKKDVYIERNKAETDNII